MRAVAVLVAALALAAPAAAAPPVTLPPLAGPSAVGTVALRIVVPARHRQLMVQLFYPTSAPQGHPLAPYMPARTAALFERAVGLPAGTVARIRTRARLGAPVSAGRHPVLLYSPGSSELRSDATALVENLASLGYVVVTIDHTGESELVEFPGGRIVRGSFVDTGPASNERAIGIRVADVRDVLDRLALLDGRGRFAGSLELARTGMFGFSLGGATAAAAMLADPRIRAGADLDGSIYGRVVSIGLARPFLLLLERRVLLHDPSIRSFHAHLRGPRPVGVLAGSAHDSFTDLTWVKPQLERLAPRIAAQIDVGTVAPARALAFETRALRAFFARTLRGA
jgi:predicted dienelactone hydrolase